MLNLNIAVQHNGPIFTFDAVLGRQTLFILKAMDNTCWCLSCARSSSRRLPLTSRRSWRDSASHRRTARVATKGLTPLEVAEHILEQAALGVRDLNGLKSSAFEKLGVAAWLHSGQAG
jgi:hypothetical protein